MNIFATHSCPLSSASWLYSRDILRANKMILESTQLLCTALNELAGRRITPYRSTHVNHPCAKWVRESWKNWLWLFDYASELCRLFEEDRHKQHACDKVLSILLEVANKGLFLNINQTPFVNCARNDKLGLDFTTFPVHIAYQKYLNAKWELEYE